MKKGLLFMTGLTIFIIEVVCLLVWAFYTSPEIVTKTLVILVILGLNIFGLFAIIMGD